MQTRSSSKLEKIEETYGFQMDTTPPTPGILPQPFLFRYHGMGHYQVIAKCRGTNKFFLTFLGGSEGYSRLANEREYIALKEEDALTLDEVEARLRGL